MSGKKRTQVRPSGSVHGVLVVDKPGGLSSHDVVARVRRIFGTRKVGHAGTLDPMATGVLVVLLGEATKLSNVLTMERKTYEAVVRFGSSTDTLDAEGQVTKRAIIPQGLLDSAKFEEALQKEKAREFQIPPQISAIKVAGKRAYALSRAGQTADLAPRSVKVHHLGLLERGDETARLELAVSKGYYVRSFARDMGDHLGVPAHLQTLRRTASGHFLLCQAVAWPPDPQETLISLEEATRSCLPVVNVTAVGRERLVQGKLISLDCLTDPPSPEARMLAAFFEQSLIALIEPTSPTEFRVKRGINSQSSSSKGLAAKSLET